MAKEFMGESGIGIEEAEIEAPRTGVSKDATIKIKKFWGKKNVENKPTEVSTLQAEAQQPQPVLETQPVQSNEIPVNKPQPVPEIKNGRILIKDAATGEELVNFPENIRAGAIDVAFTPGLGTVAGVKDEVEDILRRREELGKVEPDLRSAVTSALEKYRSVGFPGGLPAAEINKIIKEMEVRMTLVEADGSLLIGNTAAFEKFAEQIGSLSESGLKFLWDDWDHNVDLQNLVTLMQNNRGAYFRGDPADIAAVNAYISPGGVVNPDREAVKRVAHALFRTTGMAAYYTGAATIAGGVLTLADEQILDDIDGTIAPGTIGKNRYFANVTRHEKMEEKRRNGMIGVAVAPGIVSYFTPGTNPEVSDNKLRKLMYFPEEANAKNIGKASNLRFAADTKLLDLVHANGFRNLSDYMDAVVVGLPADNIKVVEWGLAVKGASEEVEKITAFLNEPLAGPIGDPQKLGDNLKPLNEVVGAGAKWKSRVSQELEDYSASRLIESTIDYFNKRSPDRQRYFKDKPALGPEFRKLIIEGLSGYMEPEAKDELLKRKGKSLFWKIWQPTNAIAQTTALWLIDMLKKFFQTITAKQ